MSEPQTRPHPPAPPSRRDRTLSQLAAALRGTPAQQIGGMRLALRLAFLALALPGLPLGGLYLLTRPAPLELRVLALWLALGLLLGLGVQWLARRAALNPDIPREQRGLSAAIQAGSAPALPFLLGCACLSSWPAPLLFWALAAGLYWAVWRQIPRWVVQPKA